MITCPNALLLGFSVLIETSGTVLSSLEELSSHDLVTVTIPEVLGSLKSYTFPLLSPELSSALVLLTLENSIGGGYYQN